jgi:hypothetical protein
MIEVDVGGFDLALFEQVETIACRLAYVEHHRTVGRHEAQLLVEQAGAIVGIVVVDAAASNRLDVARHGGGGDRIFPFAAIVAIHGRVAGIVFMIDSLYF